MTGQPKALLFECRACPIQQRFQSMTMAEWTAHVQSHAMIKTQQVILGEHNICRCNPENLNMMPGVMVEVCPVCKLWRRI